MFNDIVLPFLTGLWGRRLCWVALTIACLLFFTTLIKTPLTWYSDNKLTKTQTIVTDLPRSVQSSDLIRKIPEWHLFGNAAKPTDTLPITSLQLRLIGIVHAVPENKSSVMISEANQVGKVYLVGDMLPVGVKVDAITKDGVILENAGRLEKLPLQRQPLSFQRMPDKLLREG
jgi:type II secretory pathway component PulC